jgi:AcrR family transcriptional regulator
MSGGLPDWTPAQVPGLPAEGLRERKKRVMRQQLSDTATAMFLESGFDGVRVTEIAAACGVSEKTVFNYFPVKEALVMDRLEATLAALRAGLSDPRLTPVEAALRVLDQELGAMTGWLAAQEDPAQVREAVRRFGDLIRATPALRAYQADMTDQAASAAGAVLAARAGMTADDPEPQIAARALLGLWRVQADSLRRHLDRAATPALLHEQVTADVGRAARLIDTGLRTFAAPGVSPTALAGSAARYCLASAGGPRCQGPPRADLSDGPGRACYGSARKPSVLPLASV